jgi:hypothetical protein
MFAEQPSPELCWGRDFGMARIETAGLEEMVREPKAGGFLSALGGPQFLVAQVFTILATILGVYLAGYVGFQRTLEYDRFVKAQQRSDLLTAVQEELKQNVGRLRKFNERLPADVGTGVTSTEWPHLRLFVWQAAGRSSSAFDVPPQILTDLQAVYDDVNEMLNNAEARDAFRHLSSSNGFERTQFKERLNAQLKFAETSILPALDKEAARSEQLLKRYTGPGDPSR